MRVLYTQRTRIAKQWPRARLFKSSPSMNALVECANLDSPRVGYRIKFIAFSLHIIMHLYIYFILM